MRILNVEQRSKEWKSARLGKITGTRLGKSIGTAYEQDDLLDELIAEAMTGEPLEEMRANKSMERGTAIEPVARAEYERLTGNIIQDVGICISDKYPWLTNSPDGLSLSDDGRYHHAVEFKSPDTKTMARYIRRPKEMWKAYGGQIYSYFLVNDDLDTLDFVLFDPRINKQKYRMVVIRITRESIESELRSAEERLLWFKQKLDMEITSGGYSMDF